MKTNFTMTKRLLFAFAALAIVASSCKKDEVIPPPDIAGIYSFGTATLIDGDIATEASNFVMEFGGDGGTTLNVEPGDEASTSFWVNAVLSGLAPCTDQNPSNWKYQINLKSDGKIAFICTSESDATVDNGTWTFEDNDKTLVLSVESVALQTTVVVKIEEATFTSSSITGTINSYPMLKNATVALGGALPNDGGANLQFIAFDIVLTK